MWTSDLSFKKLVFMLTLLCSVCCVNAPAQANVGQCFGLFLKSYPEISVDNKAISLRDQSGITLVDKHLNYRYDKHLVNITLGPLHRAFARLLYAAFVRVLEPMVALPQFNDTFYLPVKKYVNRNLEEIFRSAEESSFYVLPHREASLLKRLFVEAVFHFMGYDYNVGGKRQLEDELLRLVPPQGQPGIFVINHPYGIVETIITSRLLLQRRPDVKFLASAMVGKMAPEIKDLLLELNVMQGERGQGKNVSTIEAATRFANEEGGLVVIFADPVVPTTNPLRRHEKPAQQKLDFKKGLGQLMLGAPEAEVTFGYFSGGKPNSFAYHLMGQIHQWLKLSTELREFLRTRGETSYRFDLAKPLSVRDTQSFVADMAERQSIDLKTQEGLSKEDSVTLAYMLSKYAERHYREVFSQEILGADNLSNQ